MSLRITFIKWNNLGFGSATFSTQPSWDPRGWSIWKFFSRPTTTTTTTILFSALICVGNFRRDGHKIAPMWQRSQLQPLLISFLLKKFLEKIVSTFFRFLSNNWFRIFYFSFFSSAYSPRDRLVFCQSPDYFYTNETGICYDDSNMLLCKYWTKNILKLNNTNVVANIPQVK